MCGFERATSGEKVYRVTTEDNSEEVERYYNERVSEERIEREGRTYLLQDYAPVDDRAQSKRRLTWYTLPTQSTT